VSRIAEPDVLDLLTRLVEKSLVVYEEDERGRGRYRLMETVRQYARERLAQEPVAETFRWLHQDYFLLLAEEAEAKLDGAEQREWLERLEREHDNFRAALQWCEDDGQRGEAGLRVSAALGGFWEMRAYFDEGRTRYRAALAHPGAQERTKERASALHGAGILAHRQADYDTARALHEEALTIRRELGDLLNIAASLVRLGAVTLESGDYDRARSLYEQGLALSQETDCSPGRTVMATALTGLGVVSNDQGDHAAARRYFEEALAIRRALGNQRSAAISLGNLGNVARAQGDPVAARGYFAEALVTQRALGDRRGVAVALGNLGLLACEQGELEAAWGHLAECLGLCREIGDRRNAAYSLEGMADLAQVTGSPERAARLQGAASALREAIGHPLPPAERAVHERHLSELRKALGEEASQRAFAAGRALSWEGAIHYGLEGAES
jgi:tetratricopeptide (TPR) repeat protein